VTKLSLLLKLMEDERLETSQYLFTRRAMKLLPDLTSNIKCGNSLIGTDFYTGQQVEMFDDEMVRKINAFDWDKEFSEIFSRGGFDVVIGNPPYVKNENLDSILKVYSSKKYSFANKFYDIYQLFLELSTKISMKNARVGFIIPNLFLKGVNFSETRKKLIENIDIKLINNMGDNVFENVTMPTCIIIITNNKTRQNNIKLIESDIEVEFSQADIEQRSNFEIMVKDKIIEKMEKMVSLDQFYSVRRGLEIGRDTITLKGIEIVFGQDISNFIIKKKSFISSEVANAKKKDEQLFKGDKIVLRETGSHLVAAYAPDILTNRSLYNIKAKKELSIFYLLGLLNSKLFDYYFSKCFKSNTNAFPKIRIEQIRSFPIHSEIDENYKRIDDIARNSSIKKSVNPIILNELNKLVYNKYDLSKREIEIVEKG